MERHKQLNKRWEAMGIGTWRDLNMATACLHVKLFAPVDKNDELVFSTHHFPVYFVRKMRDAAVVYRLFAVFESSKDTGVSEIVAMPPSFAVSFEKGKLLYDDKVAIHPCQGGTWEFKREGTFALN
eukprot:gnl/TRDRNA2_/TRDRNA2_150943_c1_seq1.p2 gnl/TRDRNA2_/TRDRNA2_150943_c1~~gnl/TRDRNA2_/TRDRNA2_150943_c1_seq1.p2  ORF type:complete len:126 (-),score=22.31 gnl/TRDRNA2_/TRDRNA2_150943_c1_seq1:9-386(-)